MSNLSDRAQKIERVNNNIRDHNTSMFTVLIFALANCVIGLAPWELMWAAAGWITYDVVAIMAALWSVR